MALFLYVQSEESGGGSRGKEVWAGQDLDDFISSSVIAGALPKPSSRTIWVWEGSVLPSAGLHMGGAAGVPALSWPAVNHTDCYSGGMARS